LAVRNEEDAVSESVQHPDKNGVRDLSTLKAQEPVEAQNTAETQGTVTRYQSLALLGSSLLAAVSTLMVTMIAQRALNGSELTEFLLFWAALFTVTGIITGIQPEITRAVGTARTRAVADRALANRAASGGAASTEGSAPQGARVVTVTAALGAIAGALVLVSSPLWAGQQIPHSAAVGVTVMAVGVFLYALQATMSGVTAGEDRWYLFAAVGGLESAGRLILMLAAALMIPSLAGLEVATVVPMGLWLILAFVTVSGRRLWVARADVPARRLTVNILWSFLSSAAAAVLMMGFPNVLKASGAAESEPVVLGTLILAISITRSPIMIPLQAFQGVAVSAFLKQRHRPVAAFIKPAAAVVAVGAVGALAAYLVGPLLFRLIYPPAAGAESAYEAAASGITLGALVFASALLALMTLSGNMALAVNQHRIYLAGWVVAAAVTLSLAFLVPAPLVPRAIVALAVGPVCGFVVHMVGVSLASRTEEAHAE
jgi:putative membrane protein